MRLLNAVAFALLLAPAACRIVPPLLWPDTSPDPVTIAKVLDTSTIDHGPVIGARPAPDGFPEPDVPAVAAEPTPGPTLQTLWEKYVCRGEKLNQAMRHNKNQAALFASPIDSEWDGTLEVELQRWGYRTARGEDDSGQCDLEDVEDDLNEIGIDTQFTHEDEDGHNECFEVEHALGLVKDDKGEYIDVNEQTYTADGKTYRVTDARASIGVNARDGMITFLDVLSAVEGAERTWRIANPPVEELPKLRSISDITWGLWNRMHPNKVNLDKIDKFLAHNIQNVDTKNLVREILKRQPVPPQNRKIKVPKWPGLVFNIDSEEGKAMLGSPDGVAVGYFLAQHKDQLGRNKFVNQVSLSGLTAT